MNIIATYKPALLCNTEFVFYPCNISESLNQSEWVKTVVKYLNVITRSQCIIMCFKSLFWISSYFFLTSGAVVQAWPKDILETNKSSGSRIIGGEEAVTNEFPWMVDIRRHNEHFCGGTIISPDWIITSAQCIRGSMDEFVVVGGDHDISVYEATEQRRAISRIVVHPNYNQLTFENDIALMKLAVPFQINAIVHALPYINSDFQPEDEVVVTGWGSIAEGTPTVNKLQKVTIPLVPDLECQNTYAELGIQIFPSMICAGQEGKDSCLGDAGGPMVCTNGSSKILCGLVSWGIGCNRNYPGVYTRIQFYESFITETINEASLH